MTNRSDEKLLQTQASFGEGADDRGRHGARCLHCSELELNVVGLAGCLAFQDELTVRCDDHHAQSLTMLRLGEHQFTDVPGVVHIGHLFDDHTEKRPAGEELGSPPLTFGGFVQEDRDPPFTAVKGQCMPAA